MHCLTRRLKERMQCIYDEAKGEEMRDSGGGEHGGSQALEALEAADEMVEEWGRRLTDWALAD